MLTLIQIIKNVQLGYSDFFINMHWETISCVLYIYLIFTYSKLSI